MAKLWESFNDSYLRAQFRHHLTHVVKASYMPGTNGNHVIVVDRVGESITQIFGGTDEKFIDLYHMDEYRTF
ncbi:hypothetical protein F3I52_09225 [Pantoea sp. M_8]|nr:hypothetical protein F3I51_09970 [Pantoea sp. M_6]KAA5977593.1 hypothetical protein F3I52_09225 [Pantoea sp. M_8]KAA5994708.1 hypothetical protein F3I47_00110 [Pantoea sp. M_10]KAA5996905.1 hypothetical protein F3I50_12595 [Pantoea sp. M_5]